MATKEDLRKVVDSFTYYPPMEHFLILDGERVEADEAYQKIYKTAEYSIIVVDSYLFLKILELLRSAKNGAEITVISGNLRNRDTLTQRRLNDFKAEYPDIDI